MSDGSDLAVTPGPIGAPEPDGPVAGRAAGATPVAGSAIPSSAPPGTTSPAQCARSTAGGSVIPSPAEPGPSSTGTTGGVGAILAPVVLAGLAVAAAIAVALTDLRAPTATHWHIVGVLAAVGLVGIVVGYRFNPPDDDSAPPWDVDTVWLLPAALLTPPSAFAVLVALSVVVGMVRAAHPLRWRIVVASITLLTTAAVHASARLINGFAVGALVGIATLWIIGAVAALIVAHVIGTPSGTVLWLDDRWTLVELGCAFSGLLIAAAMRVDPWLGLAGLAPLLLAAFALRWPELTWHARIDPKTGLPNAWHWEERTRELIAAAEARGLPVSVMIIDIDRFKLVNDTYGHLAGDQVLNNVADVLRSQLRQGDLVGRFGGEEFVVTMFGLTPAGAASAAERTRARIAAQRHRVAGRRPGAPATGGARDRLVDGGRVPAIDERPLPEGRSGPSPDPAPDTCAVTCTIGLASSATHGYELTRLLDLADIALAAGKADGRDRVYDAGSVLSTAGAEAPAQPSSTGMQSLWHVAARRKPDRRTRRHGPGSMFR
jgi:diguanylate cyclase (GGDEF)-like protein